MHPLFIHSFKRRTGTIPDVLQRHEQIYILIIARDHDGGLWMSREVDNFWQPSRALLSC